mmetsp:Transcript_26715/g.46299  ORF Transcript_26715/g.46299 Transcript_26715/m.46299 type:complete len:383 (+) Transcript_26715:72-1220(+)
MAEECSKQIDEMPLNDMKVSCLKYETDQCADADAAHQSNRHSHGAARDLSMLSVVTDHDLQKAMAEGGIMEHWEPEKWTRLKTLAPAEGEGTVELMTNEGPDGKSVAVKVLPLSFMRSSPEEFNTQHPNAKKNPWTDVAFAKHLSSLSFPWVCEFLGVFLDKSQVHIMTSFASRGDIFMWCQTDSSNVGAAREKAMHPIVSQLCAAVRCLHDLGVAHRNLSTENVLLADSGTGVQVKIIDFGAASLSRTASRELKAKRSYQAPEMHDSAEYDAFLADNFAVGVIVYCMAVHYYPWEHTKPGRDRSFEFARSNGMETFLRKKRLPCNKKPIAEVFSGAFLELLCGLLAIDPEMRYSLGEACFQKESRQAVNSKSSWLSGISSI